MNKPSRTRIVRDKLAQAMASRQCLLMSNALRSGEATREDYFSLVMVLIQAYSDQTGGHLLTEMSALLGAGDGRKTVQQALE